MCPMNDVFIVKIVLLFLEYNRYVMFYKTFRNLHPPYFDRTITFDSGFISQCEVITKLWSFSSRSNFCGVSIISYTQYVFLIIHVDKTCFLETIWDVKHVLIILYSTWTHHGQVLLRNSPVVLKHCNALIWLIVHIDEENLIKGNYILFVLFLNNPCNIAFCFDFGKLPWWIQETWFLEAINKILMRLSFLKLSYFTRIILKYSAAHLYQLYSTDFFSLIDLVDVLKVLKEVGICWLLE